MRGLEEAGTLCVSHLREVRPGILEHRFGKEADGVAALVLGIVARSLQGETRSAITESNPRDQVGFVPCSVHLRLRDGCRLDLDLLLLMRILRRRGHHAHRRRRRDRSRVLDL